MPRRAVAPVVALALWGCEQSRPSPAPTPSPPPASKAETPTAHLAFPAGRYDAISNTAIGMTGALTAAGDVLRFEQGQTYTVVADHVAKGADAYAGKSTWSGLLRGDGDVALFHVTAEDPGAARNGGLCGARPTTFIAVRQAPDYSGAPALFLAAFTGARPPGPDAAETDLCGAFVFAPARQK